jgi:hypothetical protein
MEPSKRCPNCAQDIHEAATRCRHCGSDQSPWSPRFAPPLAQGQLIKWPYKALIVIGLTAGILLVSGRQGAPAGTSPLATVAAAAAVATVAPAVMPTPPAASPLPPSAATDDTASVQAVSPGAAQKMRSYCTRAAAASGNNPDYLKSCEHREIGAWNRVFLNKEFHDHDPALDRRCSERPFPEDSFVAYEACLKDALYPR